MPKFPPKVPGVGDLHSLLALLEIAKSRDKWLSDARKILDANLKAVRLLGAEEDIQKNLDSADRVKAAADRAMDNARAASESIVEEAEAKAAKREMALDAREKTFEDSMGMLTDKLNKDRAAFENKSSETTFKQNALQRALDERLESVKAREKAVGPRENRAETRLETAKAMKAEAEALEARLKAAMAA